MTTLDLGDLGLDAGGSVLLARELGRLPVGGVLRVRGRSPELGVHLRGWCRAGGHGFAEAGLRGPNAEAGLRGPNAEPGLRGPNAEAGLRGPNAEAGLRGPNAEAEADGFAVTRGSAEDDRWRGAERSVAPGGGVVDRAPSTWGLAARGARVEEGGPAFPFALDRKDEVWSDSAAAIYRQAVANQWDPATAVPWDAPVDLPDDVEEAVVQVMTYLIENENAALAVPARFLGQVHPHFREVVQALAVQIADEARHVEVFTRRAGLRGFQPGQSTAGGQASLLTLLEEPDYAVAHFLLSVLGEGTFLPLLGFLETYGPDPVTRRVAHLALADEGRHVAFGMAHLADVLAADPGLRPRLATAIRRRHDALADTAGLNADVFDALVVLAAGSWAPDAIGRGYAAVQFLQEEMHTGRRRRLVKLGFPPDEAADLSALHTRNFM